MLPAATKAVSAKTSEAVQALNAFVAFGGGYISSADSKSGAAQELDDFGSFRVTAPTILS